MLSRWIAVLGLCVFTLSLGGCVVERDRGYHHGWHHHDYDRDHDRDRWH